MSYGDVLDALVAGPAQNVIQLTIPEGLSRREIAPLAGRAGVRGDYLAASKNGALLAVSGIRARRAAREPRGLPLPGDLRAAPRRERAGRWSRSSSRRSGRTSPA